MNELRKIPATLSLIVVNVVVFGICYLVIGTFEEPQWTFGLLENGALFNALTLDTQWYRIFSSMFLHGHLPHLIVNMYGLYSVGSQMETLVGARKMLAVYFVSGIAAALSSLYFKMFIIGVGASGAIFGLFGFAVVVTVFIYRRQGHSLTPVLMNFGVFLAINILLAEVVNADNAAHFGGLACGLFIGAVSMFTRLPFIKIRIEYAMVVILVVVFILLPRYQVRYFKFFNRVIDTEDKINNDLGGNYSDAEYVNVFKSHEAQWDSVAGDLENISMIPSALANDTFKLKRYIAMRKLESGFRRKMVEKESYVYFDSVDCVRDSIKAYQSLDYNLVYKLPEENEDTTKQDKKYTMSKVWYDKDWIETEGPPAPYYRIGYKDSLGRWQDVAYDFYANGTIQMKGKYKDDKKHGVFLYYSDHKTYTSAGRYDDDISVGKWEEYYWNGRLKSETYYNNSYYLQNMWDSTGVQLVNNGRGRVVHLYSNGVVSEEGEYMDGKKQGYWYGRHPNGEMYFEENYNHGRLVNGRARALDGRTAIYDESTFFPLPVGGIKNLQQYLEKNAVAENTADTEVRVTFRVTSEGRLADFMFDDSVSQELREKTRELILNGPQWSPAKLHGLKPEDGTAFVLVRFHP